MARSHAALSVVVSLAALVLVATVSRLGAEEDNPFGDGTSVAHASNDDKPATKKIAPDAAATDELTKKSEAKIQEALDAPTKMEFTETPLQDVVDYLSDHHGISIQLDTHALADAGIGSETPVTRNLKGISLRSALRLLLRDMDLTTIVSDGVLLVTTSDIRDSAIEKRAKTIELRAYNVEEMVAPDADAEELAEVITELLPSARPSGIMMLPGVDVPRGGMGGMGGGMGGGMFNVAEDEADDDDDEPADKNPAKEQPDTRRVSVFSGANPPPMTIVPFRNLLLVRAPLADHDELLKLLAEIRAKVKPAE